MTFTVRLRLFYLALCLAVLDATQTAVALWTGRFSENNPAAAWLLTNGSLADMLTVGFAATSLVGMSLLLRPSSPAIRWTLWVGALVVLTGKAAVVASNFVQLGTY